MGASTSKPLVFLFDYIEPSSEFRQGGLILNKIQEKIDPDKTSVFLPSEDGCFVASLQLEEVTLLSIHTSQDLHPRTIRNKRWPSIDLPAVAHVCFLKTMLPLPLLVLFPYTARRDVEYRLRQDEQLRHRDGTFFEFAENATTSHRAHLWDPNTGMVAPLLMGRPIEKAVSNNYQVVCWSQSKIAARIAIGYCDVVRGQDSFFVVYDCSSADVARPEILFVHSFAKHGRRHLSLQFSDTNPSIICALTRDTTSRNDQCLIFDCETHQTLNSFPLSRIQVFSQNDRDTSLGVANGTFLVCCLAEPHDDDDDDEAGAFIPTRTSIIIGMNANSKLPTLRVSLPNHLRPLGFANIPCFLVCGDAKTATKKSTHFCRFFVDEKGIRFVDISCPFLDLRLCMNFIIQNPQTGEELLVYSCNDFSQAQVRPLDFCWSLPLAPAASAQILPSYRHQGLRKFLVWCYNQTVPENENLYEDAVSNSFLKLLALQPPSGILIVKIPFLCRAITFVRHELEEKEQEKEKQEFYKRRRQRRHAYQSSENIVLKEKLKSIETDFVVYELEGEGEIELDEDEFEYEQHPPVRYHTRNQQRRQEQQQPRHLRRRYPAKSVIVLNKKTEARLKFLETMTSTDITETTSRPFLEIPSLLGIQLFKRKSISQLYDEYHEAEHFESEPSTATVEVFLHYLQDFRNVACTLVLDGHGEAYRTNRYTTLPTKSTKVSGIPFKTLAYFLHGLERFSSIIQFVVLETCSTGQTNLLQLLPNILLPFPILTMIFTDSVLQSQLFVTNTVTNDAYFEALANMDLAKIAQHTNEEARYQYLGIRHANELQVCLFSAQQSDGILEITETMSEQRSKSEPLILTSERRQSVLFVSASIVPFPVHCDSRSLKILSAAPGDVCHIFDSLTISRRRIRDLQVIWEELASMFSHSYTSHKVFLVRRLTFCDIVFENIIFRPFYGNTKITCLSAKVDENANFKSRKDELKVAEVAESVRNLFIEYEFDGDPNEYFDDEDAPLKMEISLSNFTDSGEEIVNNNVKNPVYATIWVENEAIQQTALRQVQRQRQLLWREYLLQRRFVHSDNWQGKDESQHLVLESLNDIALWNHLLQKTYVKALGAAESAAAGMGEGEDKDNTNKWPLWLRLSALKETYHPLVAYLYENAKAYKQLLEQEEEQMEE